MPAIVFVPGGAPMIDPSSLQSTEHRLRAFLTRLQRETGVPGIALALSIGGRHVYASAGTRAAGDGSPLTEHHRFHLGCATKLALAVAALELARTGALVLHAPLAEYLPELARTPHGEAVRVRHLLSHTSGYRGTNIFEPETRELRWDALVARLRRTPRLFAPGAVFSYEHTESVLVGRILERVTGRPSLAVIRDSILEPLGIAPGALSGRREDPLYAGQNDFDPRTGRFVALERTPELSAFWHAAFSSYTVSVADLVRFGDALVGTGGGAAGGVVSEAVHEALISPVVKVPAALGGPARELLPIAFGLGAAELPGGVHGHNGLSYGQCLGLRFDRRRRIAAALGINATLPRLRDFALAAALGGAPGSEATDHRGRARGIDLDEMQGVYLGPGSTTVSASLLDGRLTLEMGPEGEMPTFVGALVAGGESGLALDAAIPQLSVGFFRVPESREVALMLGLNAYKRTSRF